MLFALLCFVPLLSFFWLVGIFRNAGPLRPLMVDAQPATCNMQSWCALPVFVLGCYICLVLLYGCCLFLCASGLGFSDFAVVAGCFSFPTVVPIMLLYHVFCLWILLMFTLAFIYVLYSSLGRGFFPWTVSF